MEIYLDNSSTTKVCLPAAEKVMECMTVVYGNPSSLHSMGFAAEKEMTKARSAIAKQIGVKENEIIFTSGGTEANNLAVFGAVEAKKISRIVSCRCRTGIWKNGNLSEQKWN